VNLKRTVSETTAAAAAAAAATLVGFVLGTEDQKLWHALGQAERHQDCGHRRRGLLFISEITKSFEVCRGSVRKVAQLVA